jgi:hypothetical protein
MSAPGVTHGLDHGVSRRLATAADQIPSVAKSFWSSSAFVSSVTRIPGPYFTQVLDAAEHI